METKTQTISETKVIGWVILVNLPLVAISVYAHYLLCAFGYHHGNDLVQNAGLGLLIAIKLIGANLILGTIFSEFKITR